jgi:selenoprotein W-related protein
VQLDAARQLDGAGTVTYFSTDIASVTLVPGTGGIFTIDVDGQQIWERKQDGGFPDAAELKRRVRDVCFPEKPLGHG